MQSLHVGRTRGGGTHDRPALAVKKKIRHGRKSQEHRGAQHQRGTRPSPEFRWMAQQDGSGKAAGWSVWNRLVSLVGQADLKSHTSKDKTSARQVLREVCRWIDRQEVSSYGGGA